MPTTYVYVTQVLCSSIVMYRIFFRDFFFFVKKATKPDHNAKVPCFSMMLVLPPKKPIKCTTEAFSSTSTAASVAFVVQQKKESLQQPPQRA
jgi:hypothetical protein